MEKKEFPEDYTQLDRELIPTDLLLIAKGDTGESFAVSIESIVDLITDAQIITE
jgi:hypothetical protein